MGQTGLAQAIPTEQRQVTTAAYFFGKRALITGGLGFIGSNLAHRLVELGAQVTILDVLDPATGANRFNITGIEDRVQVHIRNLRDQTALDGLLDGLDVLFNLAGQVSHVDSMDNPLRDLEINARNQVNLIETCRTQNPRVKIIYAGTRQVYGQARSLPVDETHPIDPLDYKGVTKRAGELYHLVAHRVFGMHTTSLRMTNVYGPRMHIRDGRLNFLGLWIRQLLEGQEISVYGDGHQVRDFNFIEDVLDALLAIAIHPASDGQVYNLGGGEPIRLLDLAKLMIELYGKGAYNLTPFPPERKRIDIGDYYADYGKIHSELGWQPQTRLRDGLKATLKFYAAHAKDYC